MKRIAFCLLAAISWVAVVSRAAERPRYGGTLRVETQAMMSSVNPADVARDETDAVARGRILPLVFDTLVDLDAAGRVHPRLAIAWQADLSFKRWQLYLRPGVRFSDGGVLSAAVVVENLRSLHPEWSMRVEGESIIIDSETAQPTLLAELALLRNSVVRRSPNGEWLGTGPFRIVSWQAGSGLELAASDGAWSGRPFLDAVRIELGKSLRDQMLAMQLGKVDVIELGVDQIAKTVVDGRDAHVSLPVELMALVAANGRARDERARQALSAAIDRKSMQSVLLRGGSEVAGSVLPEWMSGDAFLFPVQMDGQRARQLLAGVKAVGLITVSYDAGDALSRLVAARVALNAREVGLQVQTLPETSDVNSVDFRLVRIPLASTDCGTTLREVGKALGMNVQPAGTGAEDIYAAEKKLLDGSSLIPLFHLPLATLAGERVRNWQTDKLGGWLLAEVSLDLHEDAARP